MRLIAYNRKINAPIRFLYYLEVFDLFVIMVLGFLGPLFASSFLPVDIPLWHNFLWLVALTFLLIIIKVGRAPGFIQHWLAMKLRHRSFHPGKKELEYFLINPVVKAHASKPGEPVFSAQELMEIQTSVNKLRQARREAILMQEQRQLH